MSSAVADIIFGTYIPYEYGLKLSQEKGDDFQDYMENLGFNMQYSAGDGYPGWFGHFYCEINECKDIALSDILVEVAKADRDFPGHHKKAIDKINKLPDDIRENLPKPNIYIVWYSS